jgi:transposase
MLKKASRTSYRENVGYVYVSMRGVDHQQGGMFSYLSPESRVRQDHPLRAIRIAVDEVLGQLSRLFDGMYSATGRPSIPPEKLLRALLVQMLYSIRSERLLMEEIDYSVLFRWFVGMNLDEAVWDATTFTKNLERLLDGDVAREFLSEVVKQAREKGWASDEHFTVDGTLLEAWAGLKSFQRKNSGKGGPPDDPGNPTMSFHGEQRTNQTHESTTDADARLARKGDGKEAKLSFQGNLLMENRNGLIIHTEVFQANGTAERDAALVMLEQIPGAKRVTVAADKGYDTKEFVSECRKLRVTPHVAQNETDEAVAPLMRELPDTRAIRAANSRGNALKKASDGSRPLRSCERSGIAASSRLVGSLRLRLRLITWCACGSLPPAQFSLHNSGPECVCTADSEPSDIQPAELPVLYENRNSPNKKNCPTAHSIFQHPASGGSRGAVFPDTQPTQRSQRYRAR